MKKLALLLCAALLLCSCSGAKDLVSEAQSIVTDMVGDRGDDSYEYEDTAEQLTEDREFHNGYLGVSFTMPAGWWLYELSAENFAPSAATTSDPGSLDIYKDDISYYMSLIDCATLQHSTKTNHIGFNFEAERLLDSATIEDFIEYNETYMENDEGVFTPIASSNVTIAGKSFIGKTYEVPNGEDPYNLLALTGAVNDGYFLVVYVTYWPENVEAEDYAADILNENLKLA